MTEDLNGWVPSSNPDDNGWEEMAHYEGAVSFYNIPISFVLNLQDILDSKANLTDITNIGAGIDAQLSDKASASQLAAHIADHANPHLVTKAQVGLGNVDNTADLDKPVPTAVTNAITGKADTTALTAHTGNTSNPHGVTKAQVGLGNVDNTADNVKPVSIPQGTAIGLKADNSVLTAHTSNTSNPHATTKAQVGLGNVDNTADTAKPVSTLQAAAIALKESTIIAGTTGQYWRGDKTWQTLDKTAVGLGNVDNTSDLNKPVSTAQLNAIAAVNPNTDANLPNRLRAPYNWVNAAQYVQPGLDCTLGLRAAIDACTAGATLFIPNGTYQITNHPHGSTACYVESSTTYYAILAITRQIHLLGEPGTRIQLKSDVDNNVGAIAFMPPDIGSETVAYYWRIESIDVIPAVDTSGGNALTIVTTTNATMEMLGAKDCWLWGGAGSAVRVFTTSSTTANSTIHQSKFDRCKFTGFGTKAIVLIDRAPDHLSMTDCGFSGSALGIQSTGGSGTACAEFHSINVRGLAGGAMLLKDHDQVKIVNCQLEQSVVYTAAEGGIVSLNNCLNWQMVGCNLNNFGNVANCLVLKNGTRYGTASRCTFNSKHWRISRPYTLGEQVSVANGNIYQVITAGTSASSGAGPSGTGTNITDGTVHWKYMGTGGSFHATLTSDAGVSNVIDTTNVFLDDGLSVSAQVQNVSSNSVDYPGAKSFGATGYLQHQNGVMEVWGVAAGGPAGTAVTFPLAFPVACDNVQLTPIYTPAVDFLLAATVSAVSTTGFTPLYRYVSAAANPDVGGGVASYYYARGRWK